MTLRAEVDNATAALLNLRPKDLSGTLILHTMFGKDHFVSLSGEYRKSFLNPSLFDIVFKLVITEYTCFANKLSLLTRLQGPIRFLKSPNDLMPNGRSAPREVIRLVNWMMSNFASTVIAILTPMCFYRIELTFSSSDRKKFSLCLEIRAL